MKTTVGSIVKLVAGGLVSVVLTAGVASAQGLTCPFERTCFPNEGHGCAPPWAPGVEIPPGLCGCSGDSFYKVICETGIGGNGTDVECCLICRAWPDYDSPCPDDVEPPCTTCGGGGAGGSGGGPGGPPPSPTHVGLPVSLTTGAVFFTHSDGRVGDLEISRTYNSDRITNSRYGVLGPGWNASFEMRIRALGRNAYEVRAGDGFAWYYQDGNADESYEAILPPSKESWMVVVPGGGYSVVFRKGGSQSYDANGRILVETDASGVETAYAYDDRGRFASVSRLGRSISLTYSDDSSRPAQLVGPAGVVLASYSYDSSGALKIVRYPDGSGFRFGYQEGRVIWVTDLDGNPIERHDYDVGRATTSEIADGRQKLTIAYRNGTNVTTVTDALGTVSTYEHQNVRGIRRVTKATGSCTSCGSGSGTGERRWTYDDVGNVVQYQNEMGDVWTYTYSPDNDLLTETNPLQQTTTYTYHPDGRVKSVSGPDGSLTTYVYGPSGPIWIVEKITSTEERATGISYTPQGRVEDVTDPRGKVTHMTYTPQGDLETVTDPLGPTTRFGYDDRGRRTTVTDALGHTTTTHYDDRDRVTSVVQHDGTHTAFAYDKRGHPTSVTDPLGRMTQYLYDHYGLLEKVVDPAGGVTRYAYDLMGQLTALTDAMGRTTRFEYELGRLVRTIYPGAGNPAETYAYDAAARIVTKVDRKGVTTKFSYDPLGRVQRKDYSDGTPAVTYTYDAHGAVGRLTSAANGSDTLQWTYDFAGQLRSERSMRNGSIVSYGYDTAGNRVSLSLDGQLHVSYGYDDASRLTSITRGSSVFEFGYDDANRRSSMTYPNGVTTSYSYDEINRLTLLQAKKGEETITSFGYTYDAAGNRLTKVGLPFTESYAYDDLYRLKAVDRTGGEAATWRYAYDAVGNRTTAQTGDSVLTSAFNEKNQLLSSGVGGSLLWRGSLDEPGNVTFTSALVNGKPANMLSGNLFESFLEMQQGTNTVTVQATDTSGNVSTKSYQVDVTGTGASYTYDPNGNLTTKTEGTDTWAYEWNAHNELTRVTKNSIEQARFAYDPLGRRVEKVAGGVTSSYVYDKTSIIREVRGSAALKYVHGLGVDEPLAVDDGTVLSYFHIDALGSVARVTNAAGTVTLTRKYDAWGNLEVGTSDPGYAFTGREWDPEVGLYYYRARYYAPTVGRFVSEDPIKFEDGINTYTYVRDNPVVWTDPTGLFTTWAERWACLGDLEACEAKWNCVPRAQRMTERIFRTDADGTRANAFLHCFWSCCTSKKVGPCRTEKQMTAHEDYRGNPPQDMYMDLYNNYQGASGGAAFPDRGCRSICLAAPARFYR